MSAASLVFADLLHAKQKLSQTTGVDGSREEILAVLAIAGDICVLAEKLAQASRPCPGTYWRNQDVVAQYNNDKKKRKRQKVSESNACRTPAGKPPNFSKNQVGPNGSEIGICNACASALERDMKNGICK